MNTDTQYLHDVAESDYEHGWVTEIEADTIPKGLNEDIIRLISSKKEEPAWMLEGRLRAFRHTLRKETSAVQLWPHHFDIATLRTLVQHEDAELAKSVNVGFSFGDGSYAQPYAYVSPWPYPPSRNEAPALVLHDNVFTAEQAEMLRLQHRTNQTNLGLLVWPQTGDIAVTVTIDLCCRGKTTINCTTPSQLKRIGGS